ncbi:Ribose-phosphate pyrophosphokinase 1, partial [Mucuna pruriens]
MIKDEEAIGENSAVAHYPSPPAIERLSSGLFQEVIITNTIPVAEQNYFPQLTVLSVANLLGETVWRVHDDCSVSSIFLVDLNLIPVWALIEQFVSLVCSFQLMTLRFFSQNGEFYHTNGIELRVAMLFSDV